MKSTDRENLHARSRCIKHKMSVNGREKRVSRGVVTGKEPASVFKVHVPQPPTCIVTPCTGIG